MRHFFAALFLASALVACGKPGQAPAAGKTEKAATLLIHAEDLLTVQPGMLAGGPVITGTLQPARRADLRAEVAAVVVQVLKDNGDPVRQGDLLMRLDDTSIRDNLASTEEAVRAAQQAFDQTERQLQRLKTLKQQGMVSTQALEDAEIRRNNVQSDLVAAKARAVSARQQLRRTEVRAPFDGVVSDRRASIGDTVQVGRELVKVMDPRSMRFEGLVSADRLQALKVGQAVRFRVNGAAVSEFDGTVRRIDAAANATTRQVEVVVEFADPTLAPRVSGLFAEGYIETGLTEVLTVPDSALVRSGDAAQVWRVGTGTLAKVSLKLGERHPRSGDWPVLEGLRSGDRILRHPGGQLVDGQAFEFVAAASAASASAASAR